MCGIFAQLGKSSHSYEAIEAANNKGAHRGPEYSSMSYCNGQENVILGFHRLAINGLNVTSNQPLHLDGIYLICNGEIYNYKELYEKNNFKATTESDCEIILHLYQEFGFDGLLQMIDGVFAFVLIDTNRNLAFVARDPYGVRPLFIMTSNDRGSGMLGSKKVVIGSEMKQLVPLFETGETIQQFDPGTYSCFTINPGFIHTIKVESKRFSNFPFMRRMEIPYPSEYTIYKYIGQISQRLKEAVKKRVQTTERPIACLLSGGLDSSLITALVSEHFTDKSKLETYSIGLEGSEDIKYAEKVAKYLGTNHTSIIMTEQEFLDAIPEVIYAIESYDTTTVRASVGNFLVAKYIKEHSDAKVIFNGDGSDELSGGYLYFHESPSSSHFDIECKRLLSNIHYFDVLRSDRCISYHGLEARTPFLDRSLVEHYLTIPQELRNHKVNKVCEKFIFRNCFAHQEILPEEVLWRTKEAFSDGVSSHKKSWYETIQANIPGIENLKEWDTSNLVNPPQTMEQKYYRFIFEKHFNGHGNVIPFFWMPRFIYATDSSARSLKIYDTLVKK